MSLGGCRGLWQIWSWQLLVFTNRRESETFQSEMLPEEAGNSDQPSPAQDLTEQQTTSGRSCANEPPNLN